MRSLVKSILTRTNQQHKLPLLEQPDFVNLLDEYAAENGSHDVSKISLYLGYALT